MKVLGINHFNFTVSNLELSIEFYVKVFGMVLLDVSKRDPIFTKIAIGKKDISIKVAYLKILETKIELIEYSQKNNSCSYNNKDLSYGHLCINVNGLNQFYNEYHNKIKFVSPPIKITGGPNKNSYMLYLYDPDGNKIELIDEESKFKT